jgi:hypothetical protein
MQSHRSSLTFRWNILPPYSWSKSKSGKKPARSRLLILAWLTSWVRMFLRNVCERLPGWTALHLERQSSQSPLWESQIPHTENWFIIHHPRITSYGHLQYIGLLIMKSKQSSCRKSEYSKEGTLVRWTRSCSCTQRATPFKRTMLSTESGGTRNYPSLVCVWLHCSVGSDRGGTEARTLVTNNAHDHRVGVLHPLMWINPLVPGDPTISTTFKFCYCLRCNRKRNYETILLGSLAEIIHLVSKNRDRTQKKMFGTAELKKFKSLNTNCVWTDANILFFA